MSVAIPGQLGQWQTRTTFVLALSAAAVGLGNLWRFSYLSGEHGGAPFVLTYIGCLFGVVYWQTESLLTVMVAHAVYDVYALWALQNAMHELGVFDEEPISTLPAGEENETLGANETGETK